MFFLTGFREALESCMLFLYGSLGVVWVFQRATGLDIFGASKWESDGTDGDRLKATKAMLVMKFL